MDVITKSISEIELKDRLKRAEELMRGYPQVDCKLDHFFGPGVYVRQLTIPEGTLIMGKYHRYPTLNNLISGSIAILDKNNQINILTAPHTFVSEPGQKVGYAIEKTIWQNIHVTEETNLEKIEEIFIEKSESINKLEEMVR